MEFGCIGPEVLNRVDFHLPPDPAYNNKVLQGVAAKAPKIYTGCAKWDRPEWVGMIYPPKTRPKDYLKHYVDQFNSIELNTTHYKIYGPGAIRKWSEKAKGKDFLFCPKMYKGVTHDGNMLRKRFLSNEFLRGIKAFEEHLGPVFVQVSETFSPKRKDELFRYLQSLPSDMRIFLEVRHPDWFAKDTIRDELFDFLRANNLGAVITDTAGRRDCVHMHLPVAVTFIRYVGNSLHPSDYSRIDAWVKRIGSWLDKGLKELFFFMHMHEEATSPELATYFIDKMNAVCGLDLKKPVRV